MSWDLGEVALSLALMLVGLSVWRHHRIGRAAFVAAQTITRREGVALLDQTVVLRRVRVRGAKASLLCLERVFQFEFATLGDVRYLGTLTFHGPRLTAVHLPAFKTGSGADPLQ